MSRVLGATRLVLGACACALLMGGLDLALGALGPGPELRGGRMMAGLTAWVAGEASLLGLCLLLGALAVRGLGRLLTRAGRSRIDGTFWITLLALYAAFVAANLTTFDGGWISRQRWRDAAVWGTRLAALPVLGLVLRAVRAGARSVSRVPAAAAGALAAGIGCELLAVYAPDIEHYRQVRAQLAVLAALGIATGIALLGRPGRSVPARGLVAAAALCLLAGLGLGFAARLRPEAPRFAAMAAARSPAFTGLRPFTDRVFRWFLPSAAGPDDGIPADARYLADAGMTPELRAALDAALPGRQDMNLLVVALDTVRADATGFLGGGRDDLTPTLDEMSRDAVVFERAYTPYPTSNYAYSSMFTGLHPRATPAADPDEMLGLRFPRGTALAEILQDAGFRTAAVTAFNAEAAASPRWFGTLRRGFEIYNPDQGEENASAEEVVDSVLKLSSRLQECRWFLWVHVIDPHKPYEGPPVPGVDGIKADYLGDVARTDRAVGRMMTGLEERGLLKHTIVVVLSDHGEEFGEHGSTDHNTNLYEPQTHVPLLVRAPGLPPRRVPGPVSLTDLLPTALALLGLPDPFPRSGRSLVPEIAGRGHPLGGWAYAERLEREIDRLHSDFRALWAGPFKLIRRPRVFSIEVYDLSRDPGERRNLYGEDPARDRRLLGLMAAQDLTIDRLSGQKGEDAEDTAAFRDRTRRLLAAVLEAQEGGPLPLRDLTLHLFTPGGEPRPAALRAFGREGLTGVLRELTMATPRLPFPIPAGVMTLISSTFWSEARPWLRELWSAHESLRPILAIALANLGDDLGVDILKDAVKGPIQPDISAIALCHLGHLDGINWLHHALMGGPHDQMHAVLRALAKHRLPVVPRMLARRLRYGFVPQHMAHAAIETCELQPGDESTGLLLRLAFHYAVDVQTAARRSLAKAVPAEALEAELKATAVEIEGDVALANLAFPLAAQRYGECLERSGLFRPQVRFQRIHALRLAGEGVRAAALARDVEVAAPDPLDRSTAARWALLAPHPVRLDPAKFKAGVEVKAPVADLPPGCPITVYVRITNRGEEAWTGGPAFFGCALVVGFLDAGKRLVDAPPGFVNWLPEDGILPGESRDLEIVGRVPGAKGRLTPVLRFVQRWLVLPADGIVHVVAR